MTAIIPTRQGKAQSLDLFEACLINFVYPHLQPGDIARVRQHLTWMKRQPDVMYVKAHLDTFPGIKSTRLTLDFNFAENPITKGEA